MGVGQFIKLSVCHLCDTKKVADEKRFFLDFLAYTTNLPNFLTQQNYSDLENLLLMLFEPTKL